MELLSIKDILKRNPVLASFFKAKGVDYSNGGEASLVEAMVETGQDGKAAVEEMKDYLEAGHEEGQLNRKILAMPVTELLLHIQMNHHVKERELLFEIDRLLNKSMLSNFDRLADELIELHKAFTQFKAEVEVHALFEDKQIFPQIYKLVAAGGNMDGAIQELKRMEADHASIGRQISAMRKAAFDFRIPPQADLTCIRTYELMAELIDSMSVHMYIENYVLIDALKRQ